MMRPQFSAYSLNASRWNGSISYRITHVIVIGALLMVRLMPTSLPIAAHRRFVYHQTMHVDDADARASRIAATIGDPARGRMLYCLADGLARTSTELAAVADVSPSTASVHLQRLLTHRLVNVVAQGRHRYYTLGGPDVSAVLEALSVVAGVSRAGFVPNTPHRLRAARSCYDHMAGALGVSLHDRLLALGWLTRSSSDGTDCDLTPVGTRELRAWGMDVDSLQRERRRFAFACLDWSERRWHLGGALGAALLGLAVNKRWVRRDLDSRILSVTTTGRRELQQRLGLTVQARDTPR